MKKQAAEHVYEAAKERGFSDIQAEILKELSSKQPMFDVLWKVAAIVPIKNGIRLVAQSFKWKERL